MYVYISVCMYIYEAHSRVFEGDTSIKNQPEISGMIGKKIM